MTQSEERLRTICLLILTAVAVGLALVFLRPVLIPFVLAVLLVQCLKPVIEFQTRRFKFHRLVAMINTIMVGCIAIILLGSLIWATMDELSTGTADYETQFTTLIERTASHLPLERLGVEVEEIKGFLQLSREQTGQIVTSLLRTTKEILGNGVLVVIFVIFMMAGSQRAGATGMLAEINARVQRYISTKIVMSAVTGLAVGLVLALFGVPFALVFGVLAFMLNFIPSIGSVISTLLPIPVVILNPELSIVSRVFAIALPGAIQFLLGSLIEPRIMGGSLDLHPVVVLLGLIFFGMIWGVVGMILATPLIVVVKIVLERSEITAPVAGLLSGRLAGEPAGMALEQGARAG